MHVNSEESCKDAPGWREEAELIETQGARCIIKCAHI